MSLINKHSQHQGASPTTGSRVRVWFREQEKFIEDLAGENEHIG